MQHDNLRELRLKLATGPTRTTSEAQHEHHYGRYQDTTEPAILEALAHLSSEFGGKYAEAKVWAGVYHFASSGPGVQTAFSGDRTTTDGTGPGLAWTPPPLVKGGEGGGGRLWSAAGVLTLAPTEATGP